MDKIAFFVREESTKSSPGVFLFQAREAVLRDLVDRLSLGGVKGRVSLPSVPMFIPFSTWEHWSTTLPNSTIIQDTIQRHGIALCDPDSLPPAPLDVIPVPEAHAGGVEEGYFILQCFTNDALTRSHPLEANDVLHALWYIIPEKDLSNFFRLLVVARPRLALNLLAPKFSIAAALPARFSSSLQHTDLIPLLRHKNPSIREHAITTLGSADLLSTYSILEIE